MPVASSYQIVMHCAHALQRGTNVTKVAQTQLCHHVYLPSTTVTLDAALCRQSYPHEQVASNGVSCGLGCTQTRRQPSIRSAAHNCSTRESMSASTTSSTKVNANHQLTTHRHAPRKAAIQSPTTKPTTLKTDRSKHVHLSRLH